MNLRLVREDDYDPDWDDGSVRPPAPGEFSSRRVADDLMPERNAEPRRRLRGGKRSTGGRIVTTFLFALLVVSGSAAFYFAKQSGALDDVLALIDSPPPARIAPGQPAAASAVAAPAVRQAGAPLQADVARPPIPDVQGLSVLIRNAVVALHQANETGNYTVLREMAAPGFQAANSPASLSEAFADLRDRDLPLDEVVLANPALYTAPVFTDEGLLRLVGFFPAGADKVNFDLLFQLIDGSWRLFGIGAFPADETIAAAKPEEERLADPSKLPDPATMVALIRGTVIALNQANMTGNYSVLREIGASGFRNGNSLAQLGEIFSDLRGRQLDLGPVAVIDPKLFRPPAIEAQGYLRLTGFFPSRPEQVNFDLAFQVANGEWRLFGIGLNTSREVSAAEPAPLTAEAAAPLPASASTEAPATAAAAPPPGGVAIPIPPAPRFRPH